MAMVEAACNYFPTQDIRMPSSDQTFLALDALEDDEPIFIDSAALTLYPRAGILFIEGHPYPLESARDLYFALVEACAVINAHSSYPHSWQTTIGCVDVDAHGLDIAINGTWHTPETVDCYAQALRCALEACPLMTHL